MIDPTEPLIPPRYVTPHSGDRKSPSASLYLDVQLSPYESVEYAPEPSRATVIFGVICLLAIVGWVGTVVVGVIWMMVTGSWTR